MKENPYKRLPPIERKSDGSPYRLTPAQRKQANAFIRRECCNYEDGNRKWRTSPGNSRNTRSLEFCKYELKGDAADFTEMNGCNLY